MTSPHLKLWCCLVWLGACASGDQQCVTKTGNPSSLCSPGAVVSELAQQCGIDVNCEGAGLSAGNASISGDPQLDGFFRSVLEVERKVAALEASLSRQLDGIRLAFGIPVEAELVTALQAQLDAGLEGELRVITEPPRCEVDARTVLAASARCEGEASAETSVECRGVCTAAAAQDIECGAEGTLSCTFVAAAESCQGTCSGTCDIEFTAGRECAGVCRGICDGPCDAFAGDASGECAGRCEGQCQGRCETAVTGGACDGACTGECTVPDPAGGCESAVRARCQAPGELGVMCDGRCDGEVVPAPGPTACEASVAAEARLWTECAPPRVALSYRLRSDLDAATAARLELALGALERNLPLVLAQRARAQLLLEAADALVREATGGVAASILDRQDDDLNDNLKLLFGLQCARQELQGVADLLQPTTMRLSGTLTEAVDVGAVLGVP